MSLSLVRHARLALVALVVVACGGPAPSGEPVVSGIAATTQPGPGAQASAGPSERPATVLPGEPWIVYQGGTGGPARIRLVRPDGTGDHDLTPGAAPGEQLHPDWSRDGSRVAFAVDPGDGRRDIWIADADGTDPQRVFDCEAPCAWADDPAWSPDDGSLLFQVARATDDAGTGISELDVLQLASGDRRTVFSAAPTEYLYVPRWSPDGTAVVVENDRFASALLTEERLVDGTVGIVDLAATAPAFEPLLDWASKATYPDWSPDGTMIAFQQPTVAGAEPADIHVIAVDGSGDRTLTDFGPGGGWGIQPTWTPDGDAIVFVGEDVVRTQANVATVQTNGSGLDRMPWDGTFRTHPRLRPTP